MAYRPLAQRREDRRRRADGARPPTRRTGSAGRSGARRQAWTRIARSRADSIASRLSAAAAGSLAAAWAALVGLLGVGLVVTLGWVLGAGTGDILPAFRFVGLAWLVTHHVPVTVGEGTVSLLGLGLMVIPGLVLWRAGRWAARRSAACDWRSTRTATGFAAGVYATIALVVATFSQPGGAQAGPIRSLAAGGLMTIVVFGAACSREAGLWPAIGVRVAPPVRQWLRAAGAAILTMVAGVAALIALALVVGFSRARELTEALDPGLTGGILLVLLSVVYLPNLIIWGFGYVTGVGFSIGAGSVSPLASDGGNLPAFPLFAAVPDAADPWRLVVLTVPLAAGVVSGLVLHPDEPGSLRDRRAWRARAWSGALVFVAVAILAAMSGGSLGAGNLSELGPPVFATALAASFLVTAGSVGGDFVRLALRRRRAHRAHRAATGHGDVDLRSAGATDGVRRAERVAE
ncbi:MAG: DUF6350 family protein [Candidatus Nanopelagicales bacterium]|nr:DUF6350 family protein [Candidatus Nanopelagicales bacterium]